MFAISFTVLVFKFIKIGLDFLQGAIENITNT